MDLYKKPEKIDHIKVGNPALPNLDLRVEHLFCLRHGEPFRQRFPAGLNFVMECLLLFLKNDGGLVDEAGGILEKVPDLLEARPFCCRLSKGGLFDLYRQSGIGIFDLCRHCRKFRLGTPYRCRQPNSIVKTFLHVCFECLIERSFDHLLGLRVQEMMVIPKAAKLEPDGGK